VLPHRNLKARTAPVTTGDSSGSLRQDAAENGIQGQGNRGAPRIAELLREALDEWDRDGERTALRRRLLALVMGLDEDEA